jgi:photosystem II stability/assembly factor-like uncharacterized protein
MLAKRSLYLFLFFASFLCHSTENESFHAPLVTGSLLLDIAISGDHVVAVGERGHIIRSNNGDDWQQESVPTLATLTAVTFYNDQGWAVGHDATILYQAASGEPWRIQMQKPEMEKPLMDVLFKDSLNGIAVGAYGIFFRTTDGGKNWLAEQHAEMLHPDDLEYLNEIKQEDEAFYLEELTSILPHFNRLSLHQERLYLAGESGLVAFSDDFGRNWTRMETDYLGSFFDIAPLDENRVLAAGLRGSVFEFVKSTGNWKRLDIDSTSSVNSIVNLGGGSSLLLANNGVQITLDDQNNYDIAQSEGREAWIAAVKFNQSIVAVSTSGIKKLQ